MKVYKMMPANKKQNTYSKKWRQVTTIAKLQQVTITLKQHVKAVLSVYSLFM